MSYTISQLKTDLTGMLHGTSLDKIQGIDDLISRAGRQVLSDIDPAETIRKGQIVNALYDDVYEYMAPTDLKGNRIIDIVPQNSRTVADNFSQTFQENFDLYKSITNNVFTVQNNNGVKTIRISKNLTSGILISDVNGIATNGTWTVGNDATNLTEDNVYHITGSKSLRFDLDGGGTDGCLENSTLTPIDLSNDQELTAIFVNVYIPDSTAFTSLDLRFGSSVSNYWNRTVTTTQSTTSPITGWNLFRFDWDGATETGTVDETAINYIRVTVNYDGTPQNGYRLDNIVSRKPFVFNWLYYSTSIFSTTGGVFQDTVTDDSNTVNLGIDSYNILLEKCAEYCFGQSQNSDASREQTKYENKYLTGITRYKAKYKSEVEKPKQPYYKMRIGR